MNPVRFRLSSPELLCVTSPDHVANVTIDDADVFLKSMDAFVFSDLTEDPTVNLTVFPTKLYGFALDPYVEYAFKETVILDVLLATFTLLRVHDNTRCSLYVELDKLLILMSLLPLVAMSFSYVNKTHASASHNPFVFTNGKVPVDLCLWRS